MKRQFARASALLLALALLSAASGAAAPAQATLPEVVPAPMVFEGPLPASPAVDPDWFNGAVFLGGVRAQGLQESGLLPAARFLTPEGLNLRSARSEAVFPVDGGRVTLAQALENTGYTRVYLLFGVNEAAWMDENDFYMEYAGLIDDVRALLPGAQVYLLSLLPVTTIRSAARSPDNGLLARRNELVSRLAQEKRVCLIDPASSLTAASGALDRAYSESDGLQLNSQGNELLAECLRTHTAGD